MFSFIKVFEKHPNRFTKSKVNCLTAQFFLHTHSNFAQYNVILHTDTYFAHSNHEQCHFAQQSFGTQTFILQTLVFILQ